MRMCFTPLHTDPDIWGETALDFLPERWAGPKQSWNYIPFMGGRRICPAQQNALTDVAFVSATFARNFKVIENQGPHLEYVDIITFTRECGDGVQIAFVPIYNVGAHRRKILQRRIKNLESRSNLLPIMVLVYSKALFSRLFTACYFHSLITIKK